MTLLKNKPRMVAKLKAYKLMGYNDLFILKTYINFKKYGKRIFKTFANDCSDLLYKM